MKKFEIGKQIEEKRNIILSRMAWEDYSEEVTFKD